MEPAEVATELARRYFRWIGPATVAEFQWFSALGAKAAKTITSPLQVAASTTTVTRHGDLYQFVPARLDAFLATILGVRPSQVSAPRLTAEVRGDFLIDEKITALVGQQRLEVDLAFSAIGSAPPVKVPLATPQVP